MRKFNLQIIVAACALSLLCSACTPKKEAKLPEGVLPTEATKAGESKATNKAGESQAESKAAGGQGEDTVYTEFSWDGNPMVVVALHVDDVLNSEIASQGCQWLRVVLKPAYLNMPLSAINDKEYRKFVLKSSDGKDFACKTRMLGGVKLRIIDGKLKLDESGRFNSCMLCFDVPKTIDVKDFRLVHSGPDTVLDLPLKDIPVTKEAKEETQSS